LRLSLHQHGCYVVQAALEVMTLEDAQQGILSELHGQVGQLVESPYGNHVIQKVVLTLPPYSLGFVVQECVPRTAELAKHNFGCRLLQRLIERYPLNTEPMEAMVSVLSNHFSELVTDSFGNYVLQHVLEYGRPQDRLALIEKLRPGVGTYAVHRCATNLVEKALRCEEELVAQGAAVDFRLNCAVLGLDESGSCPPGADGQAPILGMAQDRYGNHIVQRMLASAPVPVRDLTALCIQQNRTMLQQGAGAKYAKHVLIALDAMMATTAQNDNNGHNSNIMLNMGAEVAGGYPNQKQQGMMMMMMVPNQTSLVPGFAGSVARAG